MSSSQRQLFLALVWAITTAMVVLVVQAVGVNQAFGDDGEPVRAGIAVEYPLAGADASEENAPSALYAGLMWSVLETSVTPAEGFLGRARVELDLAVTNTLRLTDLRATDAMLALVAADGSIVTETSFQEQGTRISIEPGDTRTVTVGFEVGFDSDPDPDGLSLRIGEPGRVPALIPLGDTDLPPTQLVFAAVNDDPIALADPEDPARRIVVAPLAASVDVNAGPFRAPEGHRLAVVKLQLQRAERTDDASYLSTDYWSLESTLGSVTPVLVAQESERSGDADELTLVFSFPAEAGNLAVVASPEADPVRFPIVLPVAN